MRSGTIGVPLIAAFAKAVEISVDRQAESSARIEALRARMVEGIRARRARTRSSMAIPSPGRSTACPTSSTSPSPAARATRC